MIPEELRTRELKDHYVVFRSAEKQNIFALLASPAGSGVTTPASADQELEMFKFKSEVQGHDIQNVEQEFLVCKRELEKESIKEQMQERQEEIAQKEKEGDMQAVAHLLNRMIDLNKILNQLSAS